MKPQAASNHTAAQGLIKPAYVILLALMTLSGMAQMPIFKRYYIIDVYLSTRQHEETNR